MQRLGADICKIATMPHSPADVLTLLDATRIMAEEHADRPLITMAMGALGIVSRVSGETFGSAATFGMAGTPSAPGQIPVRRPARGPDGAQARALRMTAPAAVPRPPRRLTLAAVPSPSRAAGAGTACS